MSSAIREPLISSGPLIDGTESVLKLYESSNLENYDHWEQLLPMVNEAFQVAHDYFWPKQLAQDRFKTPKDFINELEPEFFTYILERKAAEENGQPMILGTASARTMIPHTTLVNQDMSVFHGTHLHQPGRLEAWELKVLAVDYRLHKRGIGSILQDLVESEVKKRAKINELSRSKAQPSDSEKDTDSSRSRSIIYTLTTLQEVNERYYLGKGYKTTKLVPVPIGTFGSEKPCHVAHMEKLIEM